MELWLPILLIVLVFACARKAGRRCDLAFVAVILSVIFLLGQFQR